MTPDDHDTSQRLADKINRVLNQEARANTIKFGHVINAMAAILADRCVSPQQAASVATDTAIAIRAQYAIRTEKK